ncbi:MAG: hypothetical protein UY21_C0003G0042 [Microgenomates group bacterium GW2011_GWA1_48_10]|nr:MAG: hypothetical protein UY21_C0003G0042 [Microgenomates group bacterium GW2011_GWA1_48_10]
MLPKIIVAVAIAVLAYFAINQFFAPIVISKDTTLADLKVPQNKSLIIKNGAKITVTGNIYVAGKIESEKDLIIVAQGPVEFSPEAEVTAGGSIQLVDSADHIATGEKRSALYEETAMDTDDGKYRLGPLLPEEEEPIPSQQRFIKLLKNNGLPYKIEGNKVKYQLRRDQGLNLIPPVYAADKADIIINGHWRVPTPPPGINHIAFFNFPGRSVELNGSITGPDGRPGEDISGPCFIDIPEMEYQDEKNNQGKKNREKDALRTRIRAGTVIFGDFTLNLGSGGRGGHATTSKDCHPGIAIAGTGGQSSNLKVTAETEIIITKSFVINPGRGGPGGKATAYGKKGDPGNPGKQGGDALALGGYGGDNIKSLKIVGDIQGLGKLAIGPVIGGDGGDGHAVPGDGGDGNVCDALGGAPGEGYGEGGLGGVGEVTLPPGIMRTGGGDEDGRDGTGNTSKAKPGKNGPPCGGEGGSDANDGVKKGSPKQSPPPWSPPAIPANKVAPKETSGITWEFLNIDQNWSSTKTIKLDNQRVHLIVASSGDPDIRTFLPIRLELTVAGARLEYNHLRGCQLGLPRANGMQHRWANNEG